MIASIIVRSILTAASSALFEAFKQEIKSGVDIGRRELSDLLRGVEKVESGKGGGSALLPVIALGAVAAGAAVIVIPKLRNAVLDFNDGALRTALERARDKWQGNEASSPRAQDEESSAVEERDASEVSHVLAAEGAPDPAQEARKKAQEQRKEARRVAQAAARQANGGPVGRH